MALCAQNLKEPYKSWVVFLAPPVAASVTAVWPRVLAWLARYAQGAVVRWEKRRAIRAMRKFVTQQRRRLKKDELIAEQRAAIEANISKVEKAIIDRDFEIIQDFIR